MVRPTPRRVGEPTIIRRCAVVAVGSASVSEPARSRRSPLPAMRAKRSPGSRSSSIRWALPTSPLPSPTPKPCCKSSLAKGVPLGGPREAFTNTQGRVRSFYVHDPDGILIQFDSGLNEG